MSEANGVEGSVATSTSTSTVEDKRGELSVRRTYSRENGEMSIELDVAIRAPMAELIAHKDTCVAIVQTIARAFAAEEGA